jgi:hypothetical protein
MRPPLVDRRTMLRTLAFGFGALALGRAVTACTQAAAPEPPRGSKDDGREDDLVEATDQDEHVPGETPPVVVDEPLKLPQQTWEARVKQLEAEQSRVYGRDTFSRADPGIWKTKENSHEPRPTLVDGGDGGKKTVKVVVEHVMGANKPDAGPAPAPVDAGPARMDAGREGGAVDAAAASDGGASDAATPVADAGGPPPPVHFITTIYARAIVDGVDTVIGLHEFASTDAAPPTIEFTVPPGVTSVVAYEWCTLHGLWKSTPLAV